MIVSNEMNQLYFLTLICHMQSNSSAGSADNGEHSGEAREDIITLRMNPNTTKVF